MIFEKLVDEQTDTKLFVQEKKKYCYRCVYHFEFIQKTKLRGLGNEGDLI